MHDGTQLLSSGSRPIFKEFVGFDRPIDHTECWFYHTSELPGRGVIPGTWDLRGCVNEYLGGYDVRGKKVFDCGVASGFMSFEMERRGATVVGLDLDEEADPTMGLIPFTDYQERFGYTKAFAVSERRKVQRRLRNSFILSHQAHQSAARLMIGNIMTHAVPEEADVALFGNILLHLREPLAALYNIAPRVRETIIVSETLIPPLTLDGTPSLPFRPSVADRTNPGTWWYIEPSWVRRALEVVGFGDIRVQQYNAIEEPGAKPVACFAMVAHRIHDFDTLQKTGAM